MLAIPAELVSAVRATQGSSTAADREVHGNAGQRKLLCIRNQYLQCGTAPAEPVHICRADNCHLCRRSRHVRFDKNVLHERPDDELKTSAVRTGLQIRRRKLESRPAKTHSASRVPVRLRNADPRIKRVQSPGIVAVVDAFVNGRRS